MLLYTLTKNFMEVQGYMLNPFGIIMFKKWWGGLMAKTMCGTKETKVQFLLVTYTMWSMYICIYTLHMCVNV
jgi:hypothetical protein